jgi:hypothetical protein
MQSDIEPECDFLQCWGKRDRESERDVSFDRIIDL